MTGAECTTAKDINSIAEAIEQFRKCIKTSSDAITDAARIYYKAICDHPEARREFSRALPSVSSITWGNLARLAQGALHKELVFANGFGSKALASCDIGTQSFFLENPVPVMLSNGDILKVQVEKMTSFQARQVFYRGNVRDIGEQRAWLETQKTSKAIRGAKATTSAQIRIENKQLHIGEHSFTISDLRGFIRRMQ